MAVVDTRQPLQMQTKTACIQQQCNGLPGHQQQKHFGMLRVEGRLAGIMQQLIWPCIGDDARTRNMHAM